MMSKRSTSENENPANQQGLGNLTHVHHPPKKQKVKNDGVALASGQRALSTGINDEQHTDGLPNFEKQTALKVIEKNMKAASGVGGSSLNNVASLENKLSHLQKKYKDLKSIRYTEPERLLNNLQAKYEERSKLQIDQIETWAARATELKARMQQLEGHGDDHEQTNNVEQLKVKVRKLRDRLSKAEQERDSVLNTLNAQSHVVVSDNSGALGSFIGHMGRPDAADNSKKINKFFETLTSLSLEVHPSVPKMFVCSGKSVSKNVEIRFELGVVQDGDGVDEILYTPVQNTQLLAPHLQEEISFEPNFAPVFLGQIMQNIRTV
eukprot:Stramenopile-MAST_4_protein_530